MLAAAILISLPYSTSLQTLGISSPLLYSGIPSDQCQNLLSVYGEAVGNYDKCVAQFARPVRMCTECYEQFEKFNNAYNSLDKNVDINNKTCKSELVNKDRLQIVQTVYADGYSLWESAKCHNCLKGSGEDLQLNNITRDFMKLYYVFFTCVMNQTDDQGVRNNSAACKTCQKSYDKLNNYYENHMGNRNKGDWKLCMDVIDSMNTTRQVWSIELSCLKKPPLDTTLLACMGSSLVVVGLFYILTRLFNPDKTDSRVLKNKRLFDRFFSRSRLDGYGSFIDDDTTINT